MGESFWFSRWEKAENGESTFPKEITERACQRLEACLVLGEGSAFGS